jgi:hypothetical protein
MRPAKRGTLPGASLVLPNTSPEQIRNQRLTTQTDVYALSVSCTSCWREAPYRSQRPAAGRAGAGHLRRNRPPSQVADSAAVRRALSGDLDAIVLHAMAKEPACRRLGRASRS